MRMWVLSLLALPALGCGPKQGDGVPDGLIPRHTVERELPDGVIQEAIDLNGDSTPNVVNYYVPREGQARHLIRKEVDLNMNGNVDVITHFDESGQIEREESDSTFDGSINWVDHYQAGVRVMSEADTTFDGYMDVFTYYDADGRVIRKERDTTGDQRIDTWERFDDGEVTRIARDTDGDGRMNEREE